MDKWMTPAAATIVIGAVVWGIQLNVAVSSLTATVARNETDINRNEARKDKLSENTLRASVILDRLEQRVARVEKRISELEEREKNR